MALSYNFVEVLGGGKLAVSERPKLKDIKKLVSAECEHVVTILAPRGEEAHRIGIEVESCGMKWEWLKLSHANTITEEERVLFKKSIQVIYDAILAKENVLVHCSAGLHRTGMFVYALLRKGYIEADEALRIIGEIRKETRDALEGKYLLLAEELY